MSASVFLRSLIRRSSAASMFQRPRVMCCQYSTQAPDYYLPEDKMPNVSDFVSKGEPAKHAELVITHRFEGFKAPEILSVLGLVTKHFSVEDASTAFKRHLTLPHAQPDNDEALFAFGLKNFFRGFTDSEMETLHSSSPKFALMEDAPLVSQRPKTRKGRLNSSKDHLASRATFMTSLTFDDFGPYEMRPLLNVVDRYLDVAGANKALLEYLVSLQKQKLKLKPDLGRGDIGVLSRVEAVLQGFEPSELKALRPFLRQYTDSVSEGVSAYLNSHKASQLLELESSSSSKAKKPKGMKYKTRALHKQHRIFNKIKVTLAEDPEL